MIIICDNYIKKIQQNTHTVKSRQISSESVTLALSRAVTSPSSRLLLRVCPSVRCFGEDTCLSIPDIKAVVMVLPPSEPRITITGSNRLVRPAGDLRAPLGVAPFKELHITSTVMKGDSFGGCEWRGCLCASRVTPAL